MGRQWFVAMILLVCLGIVAGCGSNVVKMSDEEAARGQKAVEDQMKQMGFNPAQFQKVYLTDNDKKYHTAQCEDAKDRLDDLKSRAPEMATFMGYTPCEKCAGAASGQYPGPQ